MQCQKCEYMPEKCSVENLYGIGQLKSCPFLSEPVLNESGWLMNPSFIEKYQISSGHIFLIPEMIGRKWVINWTITKNGAGSCGKTEADLFIFSYKKAIKDITNHYKIDEKDKLEILDIFDKKFDDRRTFISMDNSDEPEEVKTEYISPFTDIEYGKCGDQLELF